MKKTIFVTLLSILPMLASAATIGGVLITIQGLLNKVVPILITLAIIYFIWGLAMFIKDSDNEEKRKEGQQKMLWGIIAFFVIFSMWGLVNLIGATFGITPGAGAVPIPQFPK